MEYFSGDFLKWDLTHRSNLARDGSSVGSFFRLGGWFCRKWPPQRWKAMDVTSFMDVRHKKAKTCYFVRLSRRIDEFGIPRMCSPCFKLSMTIISSSIEKRISDLFKPSPSCQRFPQRFDKWSTTKALVVST